MLEGLRTFGHEPAAEVVENGSQLMTVHFLGHFWEIVLEKIFDFNVEFFSQYLPNLVAGKFALVSALQLHENSVNRCDLNPSPFPTIHSQQTHILDAGIKLFSNLLPGAWFIVFNEI